MSCETDQACRGLVAEAGSFEVQRSRAAAGCSGGRPGSSRRACSPAGTMNDKTHFSVSPLATVYWTGVQIAQKRVELKKRRVSGGCEECVQGSPPGSAAGAG